MKIYDISQELFTCAVFPGDPAPIGERVKSMSQGELYNLTNVSMCAHNGTHVDAPFHFIADGKTVDKMELSRTVGYAYVTTHDEDITAPIAEEILTSAKAAHSEGALRILIKGKGVVTLDAARIFADRGVMLIGTEYQSVGPASSPRDVHVMLLSKEVVLLEGIRLDAVMDGVYMLCAQPINLGGCDGAPCRAILIDI